MTTGNPARHQDQPAPVTVEMIEAGEYRLTAPDGTPGNLRYIGWRSRHGHQWRLRSPALAQDIRLGSRRAGIASFARLCQRAA